MLTMSSVSLDPMRRAEAIEAGWLAYCERAEGLRDAYLSACAGWAVDAVCCGAEVIGALFHKDGLIHLGIVPAWRGRWASRRVIREMLQRGTKTEILPIDDVGFLNRVRGIACHS